MIAGAVENLRQYFHRRSIAYRQVFSKENQFTHTVLSDLAKFCRAHTSEFHPDPRVHAMLSGRREVYLRILEYLELTPDELMALHKIKEVKTD